MRSVHFVRAVVALALASLSTGCDPKAGDRPPSAATQMLPVKVLVSTPISRQVTDFSPFTGRTEASATVEVRARVSGYLQKVAFKDGDQVEKDQVLFEIDPRPYQADLDKAKADIALAETRLKRADADYKRAASLSRTPGAISQQEIDKYLADRNESDAALKASQAAADRLDLYLKWTKVTAPIAGRVGRRLVDAGNLVSADTTLLTTIVQEDQMYAYFDVDEPTEQRVKGEIRAGKVKSADDSDMPVELGLGDDPTFPHKGTINYVDNQVDPATGTLRLRAVFPNPAMNNVRVLTSGEFCRVRVQIGAPYPALLVAERAILTEQTDTYVLVVNAKDEVVRKLVKTGPPQEAGLRVIASGLSPDDRVIVDGMMRVREGAKVVPELVTMPGAEKKG